jgi:hypothetical protein
MSMVVENGIGRPQQNLADSSSAIISNAFFFLFAAAIVFCLLSGDVTTACVEVME